MKNEKSSPQLRNPASAGQLKIENLLIALAILSGVVFALPVQANAFWPFDLFKRKAQSGGERWSNQ